MGGGGKKMKKIVWIMGILVISLIAKEAPASKPDDAQSVKAGEITTKDLHKLISDDVEEFYILDIREPDQIHHGEIFHLNLVSITRGYLEFKIEKAIPDKKAHIIVYCCSGQRGALAAKTLQEMGYANVHNLKGGMRQWVDDGYPLDTVFGEMIVK